MKLRPNASLTTVAVAVGDVLRRRGIRAVLTGGACAGIYSAGAYVSFDADFVVLGEVKRKPLEDAMASLGFHRERDRFVHPDLEYFVEFLPGPVAIGADDSIQPRKRTLGKAQLLMLSPTDSCRDRLAASYHWKDRQSRAAAVQIAVRNRLDWRLLAKWSKTEGFTEQFEEFRAAVARERRRVRGSSASRAARP